jgi:probable rRNA maturation factor
MRFRFIQEIPLPKEIARRRKSFEASACRGATAALRHEGVNPDQVLTVIFAERDRVRRLNRRFRDKNRFTDVIAFRYEEDAEGFQLSGVRSNVRPFGDLYISVAQARYNAKKFGVTLREELLRLVVHGTLHLLGYTDYVPREKKKMWAVQERILKRLP